MRPHSSHIFTYDNKSLSLSEDIIWHVYFHRRVQRYRMGASQLSPHYVFSSLRREIGYVCELRFQCSSNKPMTSMSFALAYVQTFFITLKPVLLKGTSFKIYANFEVSVMLIYFTDLLFLSRLRGKKQLSSCRLAYMKICSLGFTLS